MLQPDTLQQALATADASPSLREAAAWLRQQHAGLRVVVVDALDMRDETPAAQSSRHLLYLGASDGHCWHVTADLEQAAGLFMAVRA